MCGGWNKGRYSSGFIINSLLKESNLEEPMKLQISFKQTILKSIASLSSTDTGLLGGQWGCLILPGVETCLRSSKQLASWTLRSPWLLPILSPFDGIMQLRADSFHLIGSDLWPSAETLRCPGENSVLLQGVFLTGSISFHFQ